MTQQLEIKFRTVYEGSQEHQALLPHAYQAGDNVARAQNVIGAPAVNIDKVILHLHSANPLTIFAKIGPFNHIHVEEGLGLNTKFSADALQSLVQTTLIIPKDTELHCSALADQQNFYILELVGAAGADASDMDCS